MIRKALRALLADESGLETVEYAVMAALIVIGLVVAVQGLGTAIEKNITDLTTTVGTR